MDSSWSLRISVGSSVRTHVPLWRGCWQWGRLCMSWGCADGKSVYFSLSFALNCSKNMEIFCKVSWTPVFAVLAVAGPWSGHALEPPQGLGRHPLKGPTLDVWAVSALLSPVLAFLLSPQAIWIPIRDLFVIHSLLFLFWSMPNFLSWLTLSQQPKH